MNDRRDGNLQSSRKVDELAPRGVANASLDAGQVGRMHVGRVREIFDRQAAPPAKPADRTAKIRIGGHKDRHIPDGRCMDPLLEQAIFALTDKCLPDMCILCAFNEFALHIGHRRPFTDAFQSPTRPRRGATVKRRHLERHLHAHGCHKVDEGANHARWRGPRGARSVIPRHREVDFRLARNICRQLQVPLPQGSR